MYGCADEQLPHVQHEEAAGASVNEYEASLVIKSGAELLSSASSDPRSEEGYKAVRANISEALNRIAEALANFEAGSGAPSRSAGWVQDLHRVADDLVDRQG
jgi:hypothetical protein